MTVPFYESHEMVLKISQRKPCANTTVKVLLDAYA